MLPTPVLVTFVLVLGIIGATYYLLVLKPEEEEQSALRKRLKGSVPAALKNASLQRQDSPLSTIPIIDTLLAGGSRFSRPIQKLIDRSGMNLTVGALLLMCLCAGVAGYLLLQPRTLAGWQGGLSRPPSRALEGR